MARQASAEIDLRDGPFASVKLVVDLETTCYPFEKWETNPPPAGQNWPADCDAFDRNFEFSLNDPVDPAVDPLGIELVRAITPFGGPLHLEVDLTDVTNGLPMGKHRLRVVIRTWSDGSGQVSGSSGGWNVSAVIDGGARASAAQGAGRGLAVQRLADDRERAWTARRGGACGDRELASGVPRDRPPRR